MATLLLAEDPLADPLSSALLADAAAALGPCMLAGHPAPPAPLLAPGPAPARVALAGVFLRREALEAALAEATRLAGAGAAVLAWNLSVEGEAARAAPPAGVAVLDHAEALHIRDHRSLNVLTLWRVAARMRLRPYAERNLVADPGLALMLPRGPVLGFCMRGGQEIRLSWRARIPAIRRILAPHAGWPVLPLPVAPPIEGSTSDDAAGTRDALAAILPEARLALPEMLDPAWWRQAVTPARLAGLVGACGAVASQRDLPAALAIAAGVPVQGIALGADRRIISCMATLANELPPGSALHYPAPG
ncbi:MAG TPA: hypothetical protein VE033_07435 [Acetobacteraceae bacterium]|nr:hypothetical protein [Acetobacteraceae bacterium]